MRTHDEFVSALNEAKTYDQSVKLYKERRTELKGVYAAAQALQREGSLRGSAWADFMEAYTTAAKAHKACWARIEVAFHRNVGSRTSVPHADAVKALDAFMKTQA